MSHDLPYNPEYPNLVCLACGERRDTPICRVDRILELEAENAKLREALISVRDCLGFMFDKEDRDLVKAALQENDHETT